MKRLVIWALLLVVILAGAFAVWVALGEVQPYKGYAIEITNEANPQ